MSNETGFVRLPLECHGCGRPNDGELYERVAEQCDETTLYYTCSECGVGVRTDRPERDRNVQ